MRDVNPPVGGHVWMVLCWAVAAIMPIAAIQMAFEGEVIGGLLSLALGTPMFYYFGKQGNELNREARAFRSYLRANHHWMSASGVMMRLFVPVILALVVIADVVLFQPIIWKEIALGLVLLIMSSVFSTTFSSFGNLLVSSESVR